MTSIAYLPIAKDALSAAKSLENLLALALASPTASTSAPRSFLDILAKSLLYSLYLVEEGSIASEGDQSEYWLRVNRSAPCVSPQGVVPGNCGVRRGLRSFSRLLCNSGAQRAPPHLGHPVIPTLNP